MKNLIGVYKSVGKSMQASYNRKARFILEGAEPAIQ